MKRYIVRDYENAITDTLNKHGLVCIFGIPGVGKTTTARCIALKMREQGVIPIMLTSADTDITLKDKLVEFADERGEKHTVLQIPIAAYNTIDKDLAKSIAEAIANVVSTTLKDIILREVSGITEKSELVKKFADVVKGVGKKLNIPGEIVENAKSTLKEVSNFVDIEEVVKYGAEFCSCFLLGVDIVKLAEKLKGKGGELKLKKEVVVIIDDLAEFKLSESVALLALVDWLKRKGAKVLLVRRINLEKEFLEFSRDIEEFKVRYANELLVGGRESRLITDQEQINPLFIPDFDTFREIIKTNVDVEPEDIRKLYEVSGGMPTLAILMLKIGVKYEKGAENVYYPVDKIRIERGDAVEKAKATLSTVIRGVNRIYEEAGEKNFALVAVFVQPTAYEELRKFCERAEIKQIAKDNGYKLFPNLERFNWIVEVEEEEWTSRKRKIYKLKENWKHMRLFLDVLCYKEKEVKREVEAVRRTLLDIMSEGREKTEVCTPRMLLYALKNIERRKDKPDEKILRQALDWGVVALIHSPKIGFAFRHTVLEIAKNVRSDDLLASYYAVQMVESCRVINFPLEEAKEIVEKTEYLMRNRGENPAVMALRATTYSSIAKMLSGYDGEEERANYYMEQSEQVLSSIRNEKVMNLAKIMVWLGKAECYSNYLLLNKARICAKKAIELIEEVRGKKKDYTSDNFVCAFFKPLGEDVNEKFDEQFDEWYKNAKYLIGDISLKFNRLEDAEEAFNDALKYSKVINDKLAFRSRTARIKVFRNFDFEEFEELYEQMKEYEIDEYEVELLPELVMEISAEYMLSCMLLRKELEEKEKKRVMEHVRTDLIAYALLIGTAHKISGAFDREEVLNALKEALEKLEREEAGSSVETLASILRVLIENERERASEFAQRDVSVYAQYFPLFSRSLAELADGIQRGDEEGTNKALIKLFYLHV